MCISIYNTNILVTELQNTHSKNDIPERTHRQSTIIVGDFNTLLSRFNRHKVDIKSVKT